MKITLIFEHRSDDWYENGMELGESFKKIIDSLQPEKIIIEREVTNS